MRTRRTWKNGSTTLEYAILLPVVFACVFSVVIVFLLLYQKALIQNLAEDSAEVLSRQWGYLAVTEKEMSTGVYRKETYEEREIYWNLKIWESAGKEQKAEEYIRKRADEIGPLKIIQKSYGDTGGDMDEALSISVNYDPGLPSVLSVEIKAPYTVPGTGLMKLVGMGEFFTIKGYARAAVYDAKDMIHSTDYCMQILRGTKIFRLFKEKTASLKDGLNKMINR